MDLYTLKSVGVLAVPGPTFHSNQLFSRIFDRDGLDMLLFASCDSLEGQDFSPDQIGRQRAHVSRPDVSFNTPALGVKSLTLELELQLVELCGQLYR